MPVYTTKGARRKSIGAERVAREVLATIGRGKLPKIGEIAIKHGYKPSTANAGIVQATKTYKRIVGNALEQFREERQKIFEEMQRKRKKAPYSSLVSGLDVVSKYERLISGQSTENVAVGVSKLSDQELENLLNEENTSENEKNDLVKPFINPDNSKVDA